jgi:hypothetical protein
LEIDKSSLATLHQSRLGCRGTLNGSPQAGSEAARLPGAVTVSVSLAVALVWPRLAQRRLHRGDTLLWGRRIQIQIRHAQLNFLAVGLKLKLNGPSDLILVTYPTQGGQLNGVTGQWTSDSETENSQPGLSQGQDPSSRVRLRSTRVATLAEPEPGHGARSGAAATECH